jgi:cytochrome b
MPEVHNPVRIWDLPTRLFHWALALSVVASFITAKVGGGAMVWHFRLGFLALGLIVFRLVWGFVGGRWSRFGSFVRSPVTVWRYLRGGSADAAGPGGQEVGHNPLGGWSVLALLAVLGLQVATGLVADDEIANLGPLNRFVSTETALLATSWHRGVGEKLLIGLVLLHIAAIVFYRVRRGLDLTRPMWTGDKLLPSHTPASADGAAQRLRALVLALVVAALVAWVVRLGA